MKGSVVAVLLVAMLQGGSMAQQVPAEPVTLTVADGATSFAYLQTDVRNEPVVSIGLDGTVTLGPGVTADEAAKEFWAAIAKYAPCRPVQQP